MKKISLLIAAFLILQPLTLAAATSDTQSGNVVERGMAETQKQFSDSAITATVKAKLLADSRTHGMDINVGTKSSVVTLSGKVENEAEKKVAGDLAANTDGVKSVDNQLQVK